MGNGDACRTNHDLRRTSTHGRGQRGATGAVRALGSELLSAAVSSNPKGPAYSVRRALSPWVATIASASVSKGRGPARDAQTIRPSVPCPRKMWTFYSYAGSLTNRTIARNAVLHPLGIANAFS